MRSAWRGTRGFAAVDALVALTILATMIGLSFEALLSSRRVALDAAEIQRAELLLRYLLVRAHGLGSDETGSLSGFDWRIQTTYLPAETGRPALTLCRRWAGATNVRTGRRYVLATVDFCSRPEKAP